MADLAKLVVRLEAQSSKLQTGLEKAENRAKRWEKKTKANVSSVTKAFAALGVGIAAVKMKQLVTESVAYADNIAKTADAIDLTTKSYQQLQIGAELAGVEQSQFNSNMTAFVKRVGEARAETGPLVSFLKKYDERLLINIQRTKSQEEALALMADAIQNAKTKTDEAALANAAFSRAGVSMVNFLRDGEAGLKAFNAKANELGLILDEKMIRNAEKADDQLTVLSKTLKVQGVAAVVEYAEEIQGVVTSLINFTKVAAQVPDFINFLGIAFKNAIGDPVDIVYVTDKVAELRQELFDLRVEQFKFKEEGGASGTAKRLLFLDDYDNRIAETSANLKKFEDRLARLKGLNAPAAITLPVSEKPEGGGGTQGVDPEILTTFQKQLQAKTDALSQSLLSQDEMIAGAHARRSAMVVTAFENDVISAERAAELLLDVDKRYADEKAAIEQSAANQILAMRANVANASIGFLSQFADKSKAIAKVIIAIQKGLSIAQAIQNTAVAVTAALKYPPGIRESQIATIKALGKVQVGLIAATGIAQLSGAGSGGGGGGGGIGSGGVGVSVDNPYTPEAQREQQAQTTIIFVGNDRPSDEFIDHTINSLGERINEGSTVIIRRDSPQAQEIALAAGAL